MEYSISDIIQIFIRNHPEMYKAMQVEHGYAGIDINPHHIEGPVWTHTCMVMKEAQESSTVQKLAALCHDIGKGYVYKDIDESQRRRFSQHEAVSTFYAKEVLESFDITKEDKDRVLKIVAQHGSLYNFFKDGRIPKENHIRVAERFAFNDFADLATFYKFDHEGRFFCNERSGGDKGIYEDFQRIQDIIQLKDSVREAQNIQKIEAKKLIVLIGPPRSGKSSWEANRNLGGFTTTVSRDYFVETLGTGNTYSEKWASLDKEQNKYIDQRIEKQYHDALKNNQNIVIDMTNMSKKSRKKWLSDSRLKNYDKQAVVFIESKSCLLSRNSVDKTIPASVIDMMMRNFVFPNYEEFDKITIN